MDEQSARSDTRHIFLFGGQGSITAFSSGAASASINAVKSSAEAAILLSKCHVAFLQDLCSIKNEVYQVYPIDKSLFHNCHTLLSPPERYRKNGIIQATTLLIHQLLHYIAYVGASGDKFDTVSDSIEETTGFSSGMIPALVVASSQNIQQFIQHGVEAFRLAFWVGHYSMLRSRDESDTGFEDQSWLLKLSGIKRSRLQQQLDSYCSRVSCLDFIIRSSNTTHSIVFEAKCSDFPSSRAI